MFRPKHGIGEIIWGKTFGEDIEGESHLLSNRKKDTESLMFSV